MNPFDVEQLYKKEFEEWNKFSRHATTSVKSFLSKIHDKYPLLPKCNKWVYASDVPYTIILYWFSHDGTMRMHKPFNALLHMSHSLNDYFLDDEQTIRWLEDFMKQVTIQDVWKSYRTSIGNKHISRWQKFKNLFKRRRRLHL